MDKLTPQNRSENMRRIKSKDTKPELKVRQLVHKLGYRYRLHGSALPGKPDLVFLRRRKAIFVHGCFWHQHDNAACLDSRRPKSNSEYWDAKLSRNVKRDRECVKKLDEMGWSTLTLWSCELNDSQELEDSIKRFLGPPRLK